MAPILRRVFGGVFYERSVHVMQRMVSLLYAGMIIAAVGLYLNTLVYFANGGRVPVYANGLSVSIEKNAPAFRVGNPDDAKLGFFIVRHYVDARGVQEKLPDSVKYALEKTGVNPWKLRSGHGFASKGDYMMWIGGTISTLSLFVLFLWALMLAVSRKPLPSMLWRLNPSGKALYRRDDALIAAMGPKMYTSIKGTCAAVGVCAVLYHTVPAFAFLERLLTYLSPLLVILILYAIGKRTQVIVQKRRT